MKRDTKVTQQYNSHSLFMLEETWSRNSRTGVPADYYIPVLFTLTIIYHAWYSYSNPAEYSNSTEYYYRDHSNEDLRST